ncbi:MAG: hypothetical protein IPF53_03340 [Blastocatellia bacterium]|nr:hypothetical protein [Blastocatellia bacterium]
MLPRLPGDRRSLVAIALTAVCLGALSATWLSFRSIDAERLRLADLDRIIVESDRCVPPNATGVTLWLPATPAVDVEPYAGRVYAATSGGLLEYDEQGALLRRYSSLDGLPENAVTCLERFGGKLYVGTSKSGLLEFDGEGFTRYRFVQPSAASVSALRAGDGRLFVGTFDAGVFEFDGETFTRQFQRDLGDTCRQVTAIAEHDSRMYVGTFDSGLFVWREGRGVNLRTGDGLPSNRVTGLTVRDAATLVATDLGVVELSESGTLVPVDRTPNATGVAVRGGETWVSSLTSGVSTVSEQPTAMVPVADRSRGETNRTATRSVESPALGIKVEDGILWALSERGLLASISSEGPQRFETFATPDGVSGLSAGHVAALTIDGRGRVWAGMFDGGIDVLDAESGERHENLTDAGVREVNALARETGSDRVWVASSKGIVQFDDGRMSRRFGPDDGLAGSSATAIVANVGPTGAGIAVATNAGLTVTDGRVARTLTAFHGLPNNHAYAVAAIGTRLFVGTLGGLAEVEAMKVGRTFSVSNSRLPHNWVNAVASFEGRLFIGTYGGGVASLMPSGEIVVHDETEKTDVNPGAMAIVGRTLYVGTLSSGALVLDIDSGRWTRLGAILGSANVTAIAATDRYVFFGTDSGIARIERSALS